MIIEKVIRTLNTLKFFLWIAIVSLVISNLITFIVFGHGIRLQQFYVFIIIAAYIVYRMFFKQYKSYSSAAKRADRLLELGVNEQAKTVLIDIIKSQDLNEEQKADVLIKLGHIYLKEDKLEKAEKCFNGVFNLKLEERRKSERLVEAGLRLCENDYQEASIKYFEEALDTAFNYVNDINIDNSVLEKIIYAYTSNKKYDKADIIYNTLLANKRISKNLELENAILAAKYR